jgi:hypothetical protein
LHRRDRGQAKDIGAVSAGDEKGERCFEREPGSNGPAIDVTGLTDRCGAPIRRRGGRSMARWLIILGVVLIVTGLLWPWLGKLGLGRLPGDIVIERDNFRTYIPITTSIVISVVLSLILWLLNR